MPLVRINMYLYIRSPTALWLTLSIICLLAVAQSPVGTQPDAPAVQPQASQEEDPGLGTSVHGAAVGAARPTQPTQSRRRGSSASSMRPQDHPFLQLQQTGFDMLERELAGLRRATNTRLDRVAMLLRPLGRIASSLDRIATAMERAWPPNDPPPPPVVPLPPPVVPLPPPVVPLPPLLCPFLPPFHLRPPAPPGAHPASPLPDPPLSNPARQA
ncbi:unnamed protein product [Boreogadus saida]